MMATTTQQPKPHRQKPSPSHRLWLLGSPHADGKPARLLAEPKRNKSCSSECAKSRKYPSTCPQECNFRPFSSFFLGLKSLKIRSFLKFIGIWSMITSHIQPWSTACPLGTAAAPPRLHGRRLRRSSRWQSGRSRSSGPPGERNWLQGKLRLMVNGYHP